MEKAKGLLAVVGEEAVYTEYDYFPWARKKKGEGDGTRIRWILTGH